MLRELVSNLIHDKYKDYYAKLYKGRVEINCSSTGYIFKIIKINWNKHYDKITRIACIDYRFGLGTTMCNQLIKEGASVQYYDQICELTKTLMEQDEMSEHYDGITEDDFELMLR